VYVYSLYSLNPVKDGTAIDFVKTAFVTHVGIFGALQYIISDNGPQFTVGIIDEFNLLVDTTQVLTAPCSQQENSLVERYH
jgi:hypothetical protein